MEDEMVQQQQQRQYSYGDDNRWNTENDNNP